MVFDAQIKRRVLDGLNSGQEKAVVSEARTLLILAGAGSGKTRTLTCRIAYGVLTGRVRPEQVLAVTFSNRAAEELKDRIRVLLNDEIHAPMLGITFHSAGLRILREAIGTGHPLVRLQPNFSIYDDDDQDGVVKRVLEAMGMPFERSDARAYRRAIGSAKGRGLSFDEVGERKFTRRLERFAEVYAAYQGALEQCNAVDFGDLLLIPMRLLRDDPTWRVYLQGRYPWIVVDEFQDTNDVQMALIRLLFGEDSCLAVVGDDDQSIYRWRGAQVSNILEFHQVFEGTEVVVLEQNYRSSGNILAAANAVISRNERRHKKALWTDRSLGPGVRLIENEDDRREARRVAQIAQKQLHDAGELDAWGPQAPVAIFYRTHAQSLLIEEALRLNRVPHRIYGGVRFYERKEVKDALAYARLLLNGTDDGAFLRIVNVPARGIGKGTVDKIMERARSEGKSLLDAATLVVQEGKGGPARRLAPFLALLFEMEASITGQPAGRALEEVVEGSGIRLALEKDPTDENMARVENLGALVNAGYDFAREEEDPTLQAFMERIVLNSPVDNLDRSKPHIALMTLHNAKGLEFQHVLVVGMEDGLMPHANSRTYDELEEERRLFYVGMTRARESLTMTYARRRQRYGSYGYCDASPFLGDLPRDNLLLDGGSVLTTPSLNSWSSPARSERQSGPSTDETYIAYDDGADLPQNVEGMRVHHSKYGNGRVHKIFGSPGPDAVVQVEFEEGQSRKILARYLEPR